MSWSFRVGQKVVCVDASGCRGWLVKGNIYVIAQVLWLDRMRERGLALVDVPTPPEGWAPGYRGSRFRPLVTDTQSWLKEILETPPQPQKVSAQAAPERLNQ